MKKQVEFVISSEDIIIPKRTKSEYEYEKKVITNINKPDNFKKEYPFDEKDKQIIKNYCNFYDYKSLIDFKKRVFLVFDGEKKGYIQKVRKTIYVFWKKDKVGFHIENLKYFFKAKHICLINSLEEKFINLNNHFN